MFNRVPISPIRVYLQGKSRVTNWHHFCINEEVLRLRKVRNAISHLLLDKKLSLILCRISPQGFHYNVNPTRCTLYAVPKGGLGLRSKCLAYYLAGLHTIGCPSLSSQKRQRIILMALMS